MNRAPPAVAPMLPENQASFGLATFNLVFKHKAPLELLAGRRHRPHDLFGSQEAEGYLDELERAASESIRLAQRSLTLRQVLRPLDFDDGACSYHLTPGVMIATMLSVTNASAAADLERFDPDHYEGRRLAKHIAVPARELVSTFGHGRHACPAQRFSITAIRVSPRR